MLLWGDFLSRSREYTVAGLAPDSERDVEQAIMIDTYPMWAARVVSLSCLSAPHPTTAESLPLTKTSWPDASTRADGRGAHACLARESPDR
jgi:hypothetical protein